MKFNREKYIDLILYILSQSYNNAAFGKTMLCTLLYFIDFNYYERYGKLLTHETYIKSKKGIKPKHFHEIIQELISTNKLFLKKEKYYHRTLHKYYLTIIPNSKFSRKEQKIINLSLNRLIENNANTITQYAIGDPPIIVANLDEKIDYKYVFSRNNNYSILKKQIDLLSI